MKNWIRIPFVLLVVILWGLLKLAGASTSLLSPFGIFLFIAAFAALIVEFFKSGDVGLWTFGVDTAFSVLQVITCTNVFAYLVHEKLPVTLPDLLIAAVVLADAWISPFNSFRTALRNFAATTAGPSSN